MRTRAGERPRIAYLSGPVDAVKVHEVWARGGRHAYFGTSYLSQFFDVCTELDADGYVITTLPGPTTRERRGRFVLENHGTRRGLSGAAYHVDRAVWCARLVPHLLRSRPHVLLLTAESNYWFLLSLLRWRGVTLLPAIHNMLWKKMSKRPLHWRLFGQLNKLLVFRGAPAVLAASQDIRDQVCALSGGRRQTVLTFLPTYSPEQFAPTRQAPPERPPFRVLFAGRIEANKGVFDLLEVARQLGRLGRDDFRFDYCGTGSDSAALEQAVDQAGLGGSVFLHGFCDAPTLAALYRDCHVVVVPTRSDLEEGYNMVCAEAILAGRPVITSAVCPALADIRDAAVEVRPDDVGAYRDAILALADDPALYARRQRACAALQAQFYDAQNSYGAQLTKALRQHVLQTSS